VQVEDDEELTNLRGKYYGKICYDKDDDMFYRVLDVNLTPHRGHDYWVATCVPVVCVEGTWIVEDKHIAGGSAAAQREDRKPVYLHDSLEYNTLGTVHGPDNVTWTTSDMDEMIAAFDADKGWGL